MLKLILTQPFQFLSKLCLSSETFHHHHHHYPGISSRSKSWNKTSGPLCFLLVYYGVVFCLILIIWLEYDLLTVLKPSSHTMSGVCLFIAYSITHSQLRTHCVVFACSMDIGFRRLTKTYSTFRSISGLCQMPYSRILLDNSYCFVLYYMEIIVLVTLLLLKWSTLFTVNSGAWTNEIRQQKKIILLHSSTEKNHNLLQYQQNRFSMQL